MSERPEHLYPSPHKVAALLPPPVRVALSAADPAAPIPLLVSLPGLLSTVPISALPVGRDGDTRVVEVAVVAVAPAIATLASVRRRGVTPAAPAESVIAVVDPDPARPLPHAAAPPSADPVLGRLKRLAARHRRHAALVAHRARADHTDRFRV